MIYENSTKNIAVEFFQQLSQTFMLPVALTLVLRDHARDGSSLSSKGRHYADPVPRYPLCCRRSLSGWSKVGSFAFSFLPVMFCIAIPLAWRVRIKAWRRSLVLQATR